MFIDTIFATYVYQPTIANIGVGIVLAVIWIALSLLNGRKSNWTKNQFLIQENVAPIPHDFHSAILVLCAAMMKKTSSSKRDEFLFFRNYYEHQFKKSLSAFSVAFLRKTGNQEIHVSRICYQLSGRLKYEERILLLHFLYGFTMSDAFVSEGELRFIRLAARYMKISDADMHSVHAFYFQTQASERQSDWQKYYTILGVSSDTSMDEIRKAYRTLAMKHHPDKVSQLSEEVQIAAKEKFQIIVDAYKKIRKLRGIQ